ncbi:MAG: hypothetical protein V4628_03070 [Pseudomonadota bacterium]
MKIFVTVLTWLVSVVVIGCITFFMVIMLAGPHAGLLPYWLESVVVVSGWLAILIFPALLARKVWRRFTQRESGGGSLGVNN